VPVPPLLRSLLTAPGPSGYETAPTAVWREAASSFAELSADTLGSSIARVRGTGEGPLLALVGHIDEIGLIVTHVARRATSSSAVSAGGARRCCADSGSSS